MADHDAFALAAPLWRRRHECPRLLHAAQLDAPLGIAGRTRQGLVGTEIARPESRPDDGRIEHTRWRFETRLIDGRLRFSDVAMSGERARKRPRLAGVDRVARCQGHAIVPRAASERFDAIPVADRRAYRRLRDRRGARIVTLGRRGQHDDGAAVCRVRAAAWCQRRGWRCHARAWLGRTNRSL